MSTVDTSTWNPDADLNVDIGGIPLNADASIQQTWQAIQMLMAALKGDTAAIELTINQPDGTTIVATNRTLTVVDNGHTHTIANVAGLQTALDGKAADADMTGATASADGTSGLVPAPEAGDQDKFLKGDGTWGTVTASSVAWSDVTGKPSTFTPSSHTHGSITNDGKLGTASRAVVTGVDGAVGVSSVTATELGCLSGVTSALQTQLNAKATDSAVVHNTGDENISGTKTFFTSPSINSGVAFYDAVNTQNNWRVGLGIGGSLKGGIFDWTRMVYIISRASSTGDTEINVYPDNGSLMKTLSLKSDGTATWNGQAIQTTSDERLKTPLGAVPDEVLDAWGDVGWGQFQFLEAVGEKGSSARLHLGLIAQRVKMAFETRGLDACAYGILCHDEHPAREVVGEDGRPTVEKAVDLWSVRYAEALAMEAAFQRRRADRLEARIAALEVKLNG